MYTYCFRYETTVPDVKELLHVKLEAKKLASALKLFWMEAKDFACPVKKLSRLYEVTNSDGKRAIRFLKDDVRLCPGEN